MKGLSNAINSNNLNLYNTIVITYPSSSNVSINLAAERIDISSTKIMYHVKALGTCTITSTDGTQSVSETINLTSFGGYYVYELYYRLPSAYQEVEYITSTGATAWINTNINPNNTTVAQFKVMPLAATGNVIFGYYIGDDASDWRFFNGSSAYYFDAHNARINGGSCPANAIYELEIGDFYIKNLVTGDNILTGTPSAVTFICTSSITLNRGTNGISNNTWYYVKIYNNNQLVCDLIPCYRKSDNEPGMWDTVTKRFLTNAGTGAFTVGEDV